MTASIQVSYDEYHKMVAEFTKALNDDSYNVDQIANGWKCLTLAYLGGKDWQEYQKLLAAASLEWSGKLYIEWESKV